MRTIPEYVKCVQQMLADAGFTPYLVGGCVRDLLRGVEPSDYDMTSDALPEEVLHLFGEDAHPTGLPHGTVTVVSGGHPIEITTMRRDGAYRDNRHPENVVFTDRIEENGLYLLDEPIGGVDPATRDYILDTIIRNYNPEAAVVISTHLIADVEPVLDEVLFIQNGQILLQSSVDSIREEKGMSVDQYFREVFKC